MAFAGRQQEGRALLLSVRAGRGVVLSAPPGYSKSALLEEVRPALEAWSKVVWCDKIAPFGSFLKDLFRGLWDARIPVEGVPLSRDLEADTHKGRTLLKLRQNPEVSQSPKHPKGVAPVELLKDWALPRQPCRKPRYLIGTPAPKTSGLASEMPCRTSNCAPARNAPASWAAPGSSSPAPSATPAA